MGFVESEFSSENLKFYIQVQALKKIVDDEERRTISEFVYRNFISSDAEEPINIPDFMQKEMAQKFENDLLLDPTFFNKAQQSIFTLMETDSWKRYVTTEAYSKFLEKAKQKAKGEELHKAVASGSIDNTLYWLACGADVDYPDEIGRTPLHVAAANAQLLIVQVCFFLFSHKASHSQRRSY